jgi:membrane protease YdiL (CAAX protease family)
MGRGRRLVDAFLGAPDYPPEPADTATANVVGLRLPIRATVAICAMVAGLLIDFHRDFLPREVIYSRAPDVLRIATLQRFVLVGLVPLAIVLFLFRDHPRRYGLRIGDWRAGLTLAGIGTAVMLPLVIWAGHQPDFAGYYAASTASAPDVAITNVLDVFGAEFLFRGFLMFTLIRAVGPLGVLLAAVPFTFAHLGKPELETVSTLLGGTIFGWLDWRTGSILYSATAHAIILTVVMFASVGWV